MGKKTKSRNWIGYFGVCEQGKEQIEELDNKEAVAESHGGHVTSSWPTS